MKFLNLLVGFTLSITAFAAETTLVTITNDHYQDETAAVNLVTNADGSITGIHYFQSTDGGRSHDVDRNVSLSSMKSSSPVLRTESIFKVTVCKIHASSSFSATSGGAYELDLLEGIGNFRALHLELDRVGSKWVVYCNENQGRHDVVSAYMHVAMTGVNSIVLTDSSGKTHEYVLGSDI